MIHVVVLAPVLGRPQRAEPLAESLAASYDGRLFDLSMLFILSPDDAEQRDEVRRLVSRYSATVDAIDVEWPAGAGDYARKINAGWRWAQRDGDVDFVFLGADDLDFHKGWIEQAISVQLDTGACVIGTNDLGVQGNVHGTTSTHSLVHRDYTCGVADDPDPGKLLYEGYDHNFVDREFVGTAIHRGLYAYSAGSHVEHLHPIRGKGERDATYEKGDRAFGADRDLHRQRRHMWDLPDGTLRSA